MYQCVAADINCLTDSKLRHVRSYIHGQQQQRNNSHVTPSADSTRDHTDTDSTPSSSRSSTPSLDSVIADDCHSHHQSPPSARKRAAYKRKTKVCIDDLVVCYVCQLLLLSCVLGVSVPLPVVAVLVGISFQC